MADSVSCGPEVSMQSCYCLHIASRLFFSYCPHPQVCNPSLLCPSVGSLSLSRTDSSAHGLQLSLWALLGWGTREITHLVTGWLKRRVWLTWTQSGKGPLGFQIFTVFRETGPFILVKTEVTGMDFGVGPACDLLPAGSLGPGHLHHQCSHCGWAPLLLLVSQVYMPYLDELGQLPGVSWFPYYLLPFISQPSCQLQLDLVVCMFYTFRCCRQTQPH